MVEWKTNEAVTANYDIIGRKEKAIKIWVEQKQKTKKHQRGIRFVKIPKKEAVRQKKEKNQFTKHDKMTQAKQASTEKTATVRQTM